MAATALRSDIGNGLSFVASILVKIMCIYLSYYVGTV